MNIVRRHGQSGGVTTVEREKALTSRCDSAYGGRAPTDPQGKKNANKHFRCRSSHPEKKYESAWQEEPLSLGTRFSATESPSTITMCVAMCIGMCIEMCVYIDMHISMYTCMCMGMGMCIDKCIGARHANRNVKAPVQVCTQKCGYACAQASIQACG